MMIYEGIFVCFCTKAVHLELVGDPTTESCLATIKRLIGRRGIPKIFTFTILPYLICINHVSSIILPSRK